MIRLDEYTMPTYKRWPVEFVSGRGARLVGSDGRQYLDFVAGIAVAGVGHAHPRVSGAIAEQAAALIHVSNLYPTRPQAVLAERLSGLTGGMVAFFANSGAEAVECAIKLVRKWGRDRGRVRIVAAEGGFHGRTLGALAATGQGAKRAPFEPLPAGFTHVPFGDFGALEAALLDDVAAVLLEPVQGEAGVVIPPPGYLSRVQDACRAAGALLVYDEIQTGLGRTGAWFAYQHEGAPPDILLLGKALAGGLPMSVCLAPPEIARTFSPGDHATTFGGGPVQSAAALATLDVIESEGLVDRAKAAGEHMLANLRAIAPAGAEVRGIGLMAALDLDRAAARRVAEEALERGLLVNDATPEVVRLVPPLVVTDDDIDAATAILGEALGAV